MSAIKNDGGPAFPEVFTDNDYDQSAEQNYPNTYSMGGMTLRDYAAIKFAAAWVPVLEGRCRAEKCVVSDYQISGEACRLGLLQAEAFFIVREATP